MDSRCTIPDVQWSESEMGVGMALFSQQQYEPTKVNGMESYHVKKRVLCEFIDRVRALHEKNYNALIVFTYDEGLKYDTNLTTSGTHELIVFSPKLKSHFNLYSLYNCDYCHSLVELNWQWQQSVAS